MSAEKHLQPEPVRSSAVANSAPLPRSEIENSKSKTLRAWLAGLVLVAAIVLAYQPAWNAGFIWDDDDYVTANPLLTAPDGWDRIWFSTDAPSQYFPLVYSTFRVEHALWGFNSTGYHWVNLLLHAANALLLWRLLRRLAVPGAWLGAALFALHPVNVESVAWITQLKNTQSLFFCLLAVRAWVEFTERDGRPAWPCYVCALACHALALFSKTTACTLPAALLLVLWLRHRPVTRARFVQVVPFLLLGVAMGFVSMWWERNHQGTVGETYTLGLPERLLVATRAVWFYLGKLLWPADLTFNYPLWRIDPADWRAYLGLAAGLGLAGAVGVARRRLGRGVETAAVFFVAMLSPLLGFIMLYTFKYTFVADHYQYVASIGPLALTAAALTAWFGRRPRAAARALPLLGGALVLGLGAATWRQSRQYENLETLWSATVARNPDSYMGHNNLGAIRLGQGRADEAIAHFRRALAIRPGHDNSLANLGGALLRAGRAEEALAPLGELAAAAPGDVAAHRGLAAACVALGRGDDALAHARRALALRPGDAEALNSFGAGLLLLGRTDEAAAAFGRALTQRPEFPDALRNLGLAHVRSGRPDEALAPFRRALELEPADARTRFELGFALIGAGRKPEALEALRAASAAGPDSVEIHRVLAVLLLELGQTRESLGHQRRVLALAPADVAALAGLGWTLATAADDALRDGPEALRLAREARRLAGDADAAVWRLLAAAQAETGDFVAATASARRAAELAEANRDAFLADAARAQLALHESGRPWREGAVGEGATP